MVERGGRKAFLRDEGLAHKKEKKGKKKKKIRKKTDIHESKEKDSSTYSFQQRY